MFITIQSHQYQKHQILLEQMFRLRKRVFYDELKWDVNVQKDKERDRYDDLSPAYLVWCNEDQTILYGSMRLMPTTGPTLLFDVFHRTMPDAALLAAPGIWEGTRMCLDEAAITADMSTLDMSKAFSMLLVALCECALAHGIHTMLSNYEPHLKRVYHRAGALVHELGRADGYGKRPVCCGAFEVSPAVLARMRAACGLREPLFGNVYPTNSIIKAMAQLAA